MPILSSLHSLFTYCMCYLFNVYVKYDCSPLHGWLDGYISGFLSPPRTLSHTFCLSFPCLLSLSLASALLPADEYMNEIKTERHTHADTISRFFSSTHTRTSTFYRFHFGDVNVHRLFQLHRWFFNNRFQRRALILHLRNLKLQE